MAQPTWVTELGLTGTKFALSNIWNIAGAGLFGGWYCAAEDAFSLGFPGGNDIERSQAL
jgi:hypothetical protein